MNRDKNPNDNFEDRLLARLRATVAERGASAGTEAPRRPLVRRRGPRLALAGAAVATVAAAALIFSAGGDETPAAYAVEPRGDDMVSVEIRTLSDSQGLEKALDDAGVPASVNYLPAGEVCAAVQFKPTEVEPPLAQTGGAEPAPGTVGVGEGGDGANRFTISRDAVGPGQILVLTASPGPEGKGSSIQMAVAEGDVGPCEATAATDAAPAAPAQGAADESAQGTTAHGAP